MHPSFASPVGVDDYGMDTYISGAFDVARTRGFFRWQLHGSVGDFGRGDFCSNDMANQCFFEDRGVGWQFVVVVVFVLVLFLGFQRLQAS